MANPDAHALTGTLELEVRAWRKDALEHRWSSAALRSALRSGAVTSIVPGIFAASEHADSFAVRAHAAHLWCGKGSVVIGAGAASVWGLDDVPNTILIAAQYGLKRNCPPWLTIRRLPEVIPAAWWGSCPIALPEWAAVTAYATAPARVRDRYLYRVVQTRKATPSDLLAVAAQIPRLPGRRHFEQVVAAISSGSESHLETTGLRRVFNTSEFRDFLRQHWIRTPGGNFRLDMFHPESRTAVELDGAGDHTTLERRQYDVTRDVHVAGVGILTLRFTSADIHNRRKWCRESVRTVVASRS